MLHVGKTKRVVDTKQNVNCYCVGFMPRKHGWKTCHIELSLVICRPHNGSSSVIGLKNRAHKICNSLATENIWALQSLTFKNPL
jgi:hypothetical protein